MTSFITHLYQVRDEKKADELREEKRQKSIQDALKTISTLFDNLPLVVSTRIVNFDPQYIRVHLDNGLMTDLFGIDLGTLKVYPVMADNDELDLINIVPDKADNVRFSVEEFGDVGVWLVHFYTKRLSSTQIGELINKVQEVQK